MIHRLTLIALSSLTLLAQGVSAQVPAPHMAGYLGPDRVPDMVKLLAGAPEDDSPTRLADRAIFRSTRALKGSPRWLMARNDADASIEAMMKDFSCAVGANLAPSNSGLGTEFKIASKRFDSAIAFSSLAWLSTNPEIEFSCDRFRTPTCQISPPSSPSMARSLASLARCS